MITEYLSSIITESSAYSSKPRVACNWSYSVPTQDGCWLIPLFVFSNTFKRFNKQCLFNNKTVW